jgi:hypothetical protein
VVLDHALNPKWSVATLEPAKAQVLRGFFHGIQARAVLFFSLLHGKNALTQAGELGQFLLDFLEPFMPLAVGYLSFCFGVGLTPVLGIQFLKVSNLKPETSNLFTKHCEMIHNNRIAHLKQFFQRYQEMVVAQFGSLGLGSSPGSPARFSQREGSAGPSRRAVSEEIPSRFRSRAGSSLRLKSGSAREDVQG